MAKLDHGYLVRSFRWAIVSFVMIMPWHTSIAAPWTRPPGSVFVESRLDYFSVRSDTVAIDRIESNFYTEIGIGHGTMVGGKVAYADITLTNNVGAARFNGISEFEVFAQKTLKRSAREAWSIKLSGGGLRRIENGEADGLSRDGADFEARVLYGRDIRPAPFKIFASAETGYRKRFGDNADELRADALVGIEPIDGWLLLGEVMASYSVRNETGSGADFDIVRLKPSIVYTLGERWAARASASFDVSARNLAPGRTISIGLWRTF